MLRTLIMLGICITILIVNRYRTDVMEKAINNYIEKRDCVVNTFNTFTITPIANKIVICNDKILRFNLSGKIEWRIKKDNIININENNTSIDINLLDDILISGKEVAIKNINFNEKNDINKFLIDLEKMGYKIK